MNKEFWNQKKVLLTGHTGFKGSWMALWLQSMAAKVVGISLQPHTNPSLYETLGLEQNMVSITGDVRDLSLLSSVIGNYKPEIIFHFAAQSLVRASYSDPIGTYSTNVMGTANVLEATRNSNSTKAVVIVTSDKCYENREWVWGYREIDPMGGHDPYSSSKGCAELVTAAYIRSFFSAGKCTCAVASVRAGNVIGGGDWSKDRLIPDIMKSIMEGTPVLIRSPQSIRPWQHVLEALRGYLALAEKLWYYGGQYSGGWNFGPDANDTKTVEWIVDFITKQWGNGAKWITDTNEKPHEAAYLKLDCSKSNQILGWWPMIDIKRTIQWIIEWYKAFNNRQNMREKTLEEIRQYESIIWNKLDTVQQPDLT